MAWSIAITMAAGCYPDVPRPGAEACLAGRGDHCTPEVCANLEPTERPAVCGDASSGDAKDVADIGIPDGDGDAGDVPGDMDASDPGPEVVDAVDVDVSETIADAFDGTDGDADDTATETDGGSDADAEDADATDGGDGDLPSEDIEPDAVVDADSMDAGPDADVPPDCSSLDGACVVGVWNGSGCVAQPKEGEPCDDGDLCTEGDTCSAAGVCGGTDKECADDSDCTADSCDPGTGACSNEPLAEGTGCDDGDLCTDGDACDDAGACTASPKDCSDQFACTLDGCDVATGACTYDDTSCVVPTDFVEISPGTFTMGSPDTELGRYDNETEHEVTLTHAFYVQTTEVTRAHWSSLIDDTPSCGASCGNACPTCRLNWWDAVHYANALSSYAGFPQCYTLSGCTGTPGKSAPDFIDPESDPLSCAGVTVNAPGGDPYLCEGFRLPTEAEWEFAYRAGTTTAFYNGPITDTVCADPNLDDIAWYCGNSGDTIHAVGQKAPNAWGLEDMGGNVQEWCWDWFGPYPAGAVTNPTGPATGTGRCTRGGSWYHSARNSRGAFRGGSSPGGVSTSYDGFRLVRTKP